MPFICAAAVPCICASGLRRTVLMIGRHVSDAEHQKKTRRVNVPSPARRERVAWNMVSQTHPTSRESQDGGRDGRLPTVSCGLERFIHIWCLASETTLEGAEVDRCCRHGQHVAGHPGLTVLACATFAAARRQETPLVCFVPCFRLPRHFHVQERTVSHSLYFTPALRNGETKMAAARAHTHATLADLGPAAS